MTAGPPLGGGPASTGREAVDYRLVRALQAQVADRLTLDQQDRAAHGEPALVPDDVRQLALSFIRDAVSGYMRGQIAAGVELPGSAYDVRLIEAIDAAMYGAGQLQELLDDMDVENIDINGCDEVWVTYGERLTTTGSCWVDFSISLPERWAADRARRQHAGVPDALGFTTKPDLAAAQIRRLAAAGRAFGWVAGDEVYGRSSALRATCTDLLLTGVFIVPSTFVIITPAGTTMTVGCGHRGRGARAAHLRDGLQRPPTVRLGPDRDQRDQASWAP